MAGSMKDIKLRIKSVESTMQITKAMELVASSKMRRAKERVEHSRPYFETLHDTLTGIAAADPRARSPSPAPGRDQTHPAGRHCSDRGLAGGYNSNVLKQAEAQQGPVTVLPIGKRSQEYFVHHGADLFTEEVLLAADVSVGECFASPGRSRGYLKGDYDAVKLCYTRFDSMMTQTAVTMGGAAPEHRAHRAAEGPGPPQPDFCTSPAARKCSAPSSPSMWPVSFMVPCARAWPVSWPPAAPPWMPPPRTPVR